MSRESVGQQTSQIVAQSEGDRMPVRAYSPMQAYFLLRLGRLVQLQETLSREPEEARDPVLVKAVRHVLFSTFCDCVDLGTGEEARTLLKGEKAGC
ncbi:MAG: hypothetical protein Q7T26_03830 [Dehalococcoidia bacterium]|nr:hypothetical protein [Dehalococcoidia bacterium]